VTAKENTCETANLDLTFSALDFSKLEDYKCDEAKKLQSWGRPLGIRCVDGDSRIPGKNTCHCLLRTTCSLRSSEKKRSFVLIVKFETQLRCNVLQDQDLDQEPGTIFFPLVAQLVAISIFCLSYPRGNDVYNDAAKYKTRRYII
jgi:hypothetical protein